MNEDFETLHALCRVIPDIRSRSEVTISTAYGDLTVTDAELCQKIADLLEAHYNTDSDSAS